MCTSYESNRRERSDAFSQFAPPNFDYKREIYKDYLAPIFRRAKEGFSTDAASYGIVPRKHIPPGVKPFDTMNARSETVGEKRSFSGAWRRQQLCLIPCETFFEPNYESGKPVRWKIGMASGEPFAIAGLWREWADVDGTPELSFTMLTVNSDAHPLMNRFHKPGEEKRSVVIVRPGEYEAWLTCRSTDEAWSFLQLFPAEEMRAQAFPLPPREPKPKAKPKPVDDGQQSLLDE